MEIWKDHDACGNCCSRSSSWHARDTLIGERKNFLELGKKQEKGWIGGIIIILMIIAINWAYSKFAVLHGTTRTIKGDGKSTKVSRVRKVAEKSPNLDGTYDKHWVLGPIISANDAIRTCHTGWSDHLISLDLSTILGSTVNNSSIASYPFL